MDDQCRVCEKLEPFFDNGRALRGPQRPSATRNGRSQPATHIEKVACKRKIRIFFLFPSD